MSAHPPVGQKDIGRIVCACHSVGGHTLLDAIKDGNTSVETLGECTQAGTNCGSCIPELKGLLAQM
ncbi:MAG: (2Fe-2S)-binding protein [Gammaproteobacteria bacterium]|nr:(2Fe-2S)-binding protein [Gammaproteobacteria bacterium]